MNLSGWWRPVLCDGLFCGLIMIIAAHPMTAQAATVGGPASKSGELALYTAWDEKDTNALIAGFHKAYPNIKVTGVRSEGGRGALLERLLTELDTGRNQADVYSTGIPDMSAVLKRGEVLAYRSRSESNLEPRFVFEDGLLHPSADLVWMAAYNKNLVRENDLPRKWEDLLHPKWKGKIAIDQEPNDIVAGFLILMGKDKGVEYLRQLSRNIIIRRGRTLLVELLAAGEFPISIDVYTHRVAGAIKAGAPLGPVPLPVYFSSPNVDAILKKAPNQENAKLWIDWVQSPAGQEVIAKRNRPPAGKTQGTADPTGPLIKGRELVVLMPGKLPMSYDDIARLARSIFLR